MSQMESENFQSNLPGWSKNNPVDLLIIGGGINGTGIARDAAGRGLSVLLCEKSDLSEGTSSRSGKYIHGGLRYLEHFEFRLVREALQEREIVLEAAPHLAKPLQLVLPHSPEQRPRWLIRLGLLIYDNLSRRKRVPGSSSINLQNDPVGERIKDEFKQAFSYWDVWVDDSRLVVLNAVDAAKRGAQILTRTECVNAHREGHVWIAELKFRNTVQTEKIFAKAMVNAAGPWVEKVINEVAGQNSKLNVRLVKGSHIILPKWWKGDHGYALQAHDKRLIFVNPYFDDMALVGTTDIPFHGRAEEVKADNSEIEYLLKILAHYFQIDLKVNDVLYNYSGVRPLFDDDASKSASTVTRDYEFELNGSLDPNGSSPPVLSVFGGKLTTYRKLSEHALDKLAPLFPNMKMAWTAGIPLPGGDLPNSGFDAWLTNFKKEYSHLPGQLLQHLGQNYGTEAIKILEGVSTPVDLGVHFGHCFYELEARWLIQNEWAQSTTDILFRRTKHGLFLKEEEQAKFEDWFENTFA